MNEKINGSPMGRYVQYERPDCELLETGLEGIIAGSI